MNLVNFRKLRLVNLIVCLAFCLNLGFSGSAYALRPKSADKVEQAVLGLGIEMLKQLSAQGTNVLKARIADLVLDRATDPTERALIANSIGVVERGGRVYIVSLIGNGWKIDLSAGSLVKEDFASRDEMLAFISGGQLTWLAGEYTPAEIIDAQAATKAYLRKAGDENRIFAEENLKAQVAKYSSDPKVQDALIKRLEAVFNFNKRAIDSLEVDDDTYPFVRAVEPAYADYSDAERSVVEGNLLGALKGYLRKNSEEGLRYAVILDKDGNPSFFYKGDVGTAKHLAVTASSGGYKYEGYDFKKAGDLPPRSIYNNLAMIEAYIEMAKSNPEALKAYQLKLLHEFAEVSARSKQHREETKAVSDLINKYDKLALEAWKKAEADKATAKVLNEENQKTIAEATSANIGKFLKSGVIPAELIGVAEAELQKLVASGLLTGYRIVTKGKEISILTTRQNSKTIEDEAKVPSAILNVYLSVLNAAKEKGIYTGQNLTDKSYRKQVDALEIGVPLPTLKYLQPEGWAKSTFGRIRTELTVPQGQAAAFFTTDVHGYRIAELFAKPVEQIPDAVVNAVKAKLDRDIAQGKLLSADVRDSGATDIDILVTHRFGELNAAVQRLVLEAMKEGVLKAKELGLLRKEIDVNSMSLADLAKALRLKYQPHSITERGAEPVVIAKIIGAGIGAANTKLFHEFFMPGSTPLQKLGFVPEIGAKDKPGVRGFRAIVRRTQDVLSGNFDGPVWEFEKSAALKIGNKQYASKDESLELMALASQPNDFVITAIYTVEGSAITSTEPIVSVMYQAVYGEKGNLRTLNPTFICRSQSGADAVGGVASMFYDVNFVPGGPNGENYVATRPTTLEEARKAPKKGTAHVVIYGWQSKGNGIVPREEGGIIDHVAINPEALRYEQKLADFLASVMATHEDDEPYNAPFATEERVAPIRTAQTHLFARAPKEADIDPVMDEVEAKVASGEFLSVTDDKADMGGKFGHNFTPEYMLAVDRATVLEATENGTLSDGNIIGFTDKGRLKRGTTTAIGDDSHIIMLGDKTRNSAGGHQLSFLAFTRGYLFAVVNGEKPYGLAQDYQGKEAKAAKANPYFYSHLNERFFEILREVMPEDHLAGVEKMYAGWKEWQKTSATVTLPEPFSGNVSQQGIGSARYLVNIKGGERIFGILAGDKMGPAALNRVIREGVYAALKAGKFVNGLVYEIWDAKAFDEHGNIAIDELPELFADIADSIAALKAQADQDFVKNSYTDGKLRSDLAEADKIKLAQLIKQAGYVPTKRIFLDAEKDKEAIKLYLAHSDRFNIKQVWSKKTAGWDINNFQAYLDRPILGSSVTKLGILAGGEYIGKDDPVMVGHIELMEYIWAFLKNNPLIIQGDMNGSHWLGAIPTRFRYAVANKESHPILVGLRYTLSEDGKSLANVEDIFNDKAYTRIRQMMFKFNFEFKRAQLGGQFEPYGTNERTVEASYPLAKLLRALQSPNSPFLVKNKPQSERQARPVGLLGEILDLFNVATGSLELPVAPQGWTGSNEWQERFQKSLLALQSSGVVDKLSDEALAASTDLTHRKVVLISAKVLESDPSLILALQSANRQMNQRLGIFESYSNSEASAYEFVLVADEPGLSTPEDVDKLFAEISRITHNGVKASKDIFGYILTQKDMLEGQISNAGDLLKQLKRIGRSEELIAGLIGSKAWADGIKAQGGIAENTVVGNTDAQKDQIAFAANVLFGVIEATARVDRKVPDSIAKKLELVQEATSIGVTSKEVNTTIADEIEAYRKQVEAAIGV